MSEREWKIEFPAGELPSVAWWTRLILRRFKVVTVTDMESRLVEYVWGYRKMFRYLERNDMAVYQRIQIRFVFNRNRLVLWQRRKKECRNCADMALYEIPGACPMCGTANAALKNAG